MTKIDEATLVKDRKHEVSFPTHFIVHRNEFLNLLSEFQDMWPVPLNQSQLQVFV